MSGPASLDDHETLVRLAEKRVRRSMAKIEAEQDELSAARASLESAVAGRSAWIADRARDEPLML
ncbi:hypothetical protein [Novosphingobium lindaniclasticum]